jgi:glycosyltransferase involved in cell wall biosynthesis
LTTCTSDFNQLILVVLPFSPWKEKDTSYRGIFFIEHLRLLSRIYDELLLVTITVLPFRRLFSSKSCPFSASVEHHSGFTIYNLTLPHLVPSSYAFVGRLLSLYAFVFLLYIKLRYRRSPELIISHYLIFPGVFSYYLSKASFFKIPYAIFSHRRTDIDLIPRWEASNISKAVNHAKSVFAPSASHALFLRSQYAKSSIAVFPNPVSSHFDIEKKSLQTVQHNRCRDVLAGRMTILCVGNLIPLKNPSVVLEAFARFSADNPSLNSSLVFAGSGPLYGSLRARSFELGVSNQVFFSSYSSSESESLRNLFLQSHVLVSASDRETFGLSILEALCLGLPCVVSKSGGPSDFFADSYGVTLPEIDSIALANALSCVQDNYTAYATSLLDFPRQLYFCESLAPRLISLLAPG